MRMENAVRFRGRAQSLRHTARAAGRAVVLFALVSALAACARDSSAPRQNSAATKPASKPDTFAIEAEFSAKDTVAAEKDHRILRWADSPCGMSPVVKTDSVLLNDAVLQPDFVVEFAADGRALRTWGKPFNAPIGALRGDRIGFAQWRDGREQWYWTDTRGRIAPGDATAGSHPRIDESAPVDCPTIELFGDSEYLRCFEIVDASTGRTHRIAVEAACS